MSNRVEVHTPAPDFKLPGMDGSTVTLADFKGDKHVVLIFNRGFQ